MVANGLIDATAVVGLAALGLAAALVVVVWRLSRSNERLAALLGDVALAKPWHIFQRQPDGSARPERTIKGAVVSERRALAEARLEKARAENAFVQRGGLDPGSAEGDMIEDERMDQ